jgi:hypothetical protein
MFGADLASDTTRRRTFLLEAVRRPLCEERAEDHPAEDLLLRLWRQVECRAVPLEERRRVLSLFAAASSSLIASLIASGWPHQREAESSAIAAGRTNRGS